MSASWHFLTFLIVLFLGSDALGASVCIKKTCVEVELVRTHEDMQRGLQGREALADGHGMLFIFSEDDLQSFWMKDMKFPIDMLWIDSKLQIVTIAANRLPCVKTPCEVYAPSKNARYVLELPANYAAAHQFNEGDTVEFKLEEG